MPRRSKALTPTDAVDHIVADERVVWFPIKHFSPVCAHHVRNVIRAERPVAVVVESPQDADSLIPWIVHGDTAPPFTILSSFTDKKNLFELNGVLSPSDDIPARYRGWWPFTAYSPEYVALKVGDEVGAKLAFCDVPLTATIPHHHVRNLATQQVVGDHHLATNEYFYELQKRQRRRSFEEFWHANFEAGGWQLDTQAFVRGVLTFAWCARNMGEPEARERALQADGTLMRERHMRFVVDGVLKEHPEGKIVVVTGAFHSAALAWTKKKKAKAKIDKNLETVLCSHSYRALANLYELNRLPGYSGLVWENLDRDEPTKPFDAAAMRLVIEVMRRAREMGEGVSTADSIGAYRVARNLANLRSNQEVTLDDLLDAIQMAYVKGDKALRGGQIERAARQVLIGRRQGTITPEAGQIPLIRDYYERCRDHRIEISGAKKTVRCDVHKQLKHRLKSAFLHQADFLAIPMFGAIEGRSKSTWRSRAVATHYKGPDPVSGENMHLITETWGVEWREDVDARLLELSDRGATMGQAATALVRDKLAQSKGKTGEVSELLLRSAQMMLTDLFDELLGAVEDAMVIDSSFNSLVKALGDFVVLHTYRDALATQGHERMLASVVTLFNNAALQVPRLSNTDDDEVEDGLDELQALVRYALTFEAAALDRILLVERVQLMVEAPDGAPAIRGAGFGILYSFGAVRERVVADELNSYLLGSSQSVLDAGPFLDGLFTTSKSIFMGSPRLLRAINRVIRDLDWETFKVLLPHLRRAFTQFIPTEIDRIGVAVSEELGLDEAPSPDEPVSEVVARLGSGADARVARLLEGWL